MDKPLDRLFGRGRTGWLKTALLSGVIGILGTYVVFGGDAAEEKYSKYYWILLGYPALAILRSIYWNTRANRIRQMLNDQKTPKGDIQEHLESVLEWNPKLFEQLGPEIKMRNQKRPPRKGRRTPTGKRTP